MHDMRRRQATASASLVSAAAAAAASAASPRGAAWSIDRKLASIFRLRIASFNEFR